MKLIKDRANLANLGNCDCIPPKTVQDDSITKQESNADDYHENSPIRYTKDARKRLRVWDAQQKKVL